MYILKGFFEYPSFYNNEKDEIAALGELSSNSRTYAKDKTVYVSDLYPTVNFVSFHSIRNNEVAVVGYSFKEQILQIGDFIYKEAFKGTINSNVSEFRNLLTTEFANEISNLSTGKMLHYNNLWMPEWIQFKIVDSNEENLIRIWLADDSFAGQYDEYELEIIHPIYPYDDFFKDPILVNEMLEEYDLVGKTEEVQESRREYPYTYLKAFDFKYVPPAYPHLHRKAYWFVIIYGEAGNNPDLIKEAIRNEILAESEHTQEEWEIILPDLFLNTEFVFTPFFNNYAIENSDHRAGIYSPIVDPNVELSLIRKATKGQGYTDNYINGIYEIGSALYKSLAFGIVGAPHNKDGILQFSKLTKDYILVENDSPDANRTHPFTLEWTIRFTGLIKAAEELDAFSSVPTGYSRTIRDGVVYASFYYKHVNYLMATKSSIEELDL